jgi:hypothetical protein
LPGEWDVGASQATNRAWALTPVSRASQIFNQINARSLTDDWNVYGFGRSSTLFLLITLIEAGLQAILVEFGGPFTKTTGLSPAHWGISIGLAAFTFPLGVVMRFLPVPPKRSDYAAYYQEEFSVRFSCLHAVSMVLSGSQFLPPVFSRRA